MFLGLYPRHGDDLHAGGAAQEELRAPGDHQGGGVNQYNIVSIMKLFFANKNETFFSYSYRLKGHNTILI